MLKVSEGHIVRLVPFGLHLVLPEQEVLKIKDCIFMVPCLPTLSYYLKSNVARTQFLEKVLTTISVCVYVRMKNRRKSKQSNMVKANL